MDTATLLIRRAALLAFRRFAAVQTSVLGSSHSPKENLSEEARQTFPTARSEN